MTKRQIPTLLPVLLVLLSGAQLYAADRPARAGDDGANLRVTLTIGQSDGATTVDRTLHMLMLEDQRTRMTSGWRIPTVIEQRGEDGDASLQYQSVGLGVTLHGRRIEPGTIRLSGNVELSSAGAADEAPTPGTRAPVVANTYHQFDVLVDVGVPSLVAEVPRLDGSSLTLTLAVELEDGG